LGSTYGYPAFSADGKTLIVAGQLGTIRVYDTATATELRHIKTAPITVNPGYPVVSPDNSVLAWMDGARKIKLWNIADGAEQASFEIPEFGRNYHPAFARDGKHLALATEKGVLIWDTAARKEVHKILHLEAQSFMGELAFSPDGKTLAVSGIGGSRLYEVATGKLLNQPMGLALTRSLMLAFSPDGATLAAATLDDPAIHHWESSTGKPLLRIQCPDHTEPLLFSLDGKQLLTGDRHGTIHFLNAKTGAPERKLNMNADKDVKIKYAIMRLAIDGKTVSALGSRFELKLHSRHMVWDLASGDLRKRTDFPGAFNAMFAPNGTTLHPEMNRMSLRDAVTGKQVVKLNDVSVGPFSFTPDGRSLAIASSDAATLLDLATGRVLANLPTGKVGDLELSPDGRFLAALNRQELVLWEIATAKRVYRLAAPAPFSAADGVAFSLRTAFAPNGRSLATGFKDTTVLIWDIAPGFLRLPGPAKALGQKELEQLWSDLASDDAAKAYRAIWTLAGVPDQAVPFARDRLKPASDNGKRIAKLIIELNSEEFAVRNAALQELKNFDIEVEPAFHRAIAAGVALECKRRMETILDLPPAIVRGRETLRGVRAIHMLEATGTPAARQLIKLLATGTAAARLTHDAKESLVRCR
jgi:WD40 repeat protein